MNFSTLDHSEFQQEMCPISVGFASFTISINQKYTNINNCTVCSFIYTFINLHLL